MSSTRISYERDAPSTDDLNDRVSSPSARADSAPSDATVARREMIAHAQNMRDVLATIEQVAPTIASVLITGESGVGKEVIARKIHELSARKDAPFISVNCAAIPDNLLEAELFGHEAGAFTGALGAHMGRFEAANHGTILLDEISEMEPRLQAKLLRVLQERVVDRLGSTKSTQIDTRVLATTNRDLADEVRTGRFREDLFFRLDVVQIWVPPLRERRDDIIPLAEFFISHFCAANERAPKTLDQSAKELLLAQEWRGNVRALEHCMHRCVLLCPAPILSAENINPLIAALDHEGPHAKAERETAQDQPLAGRALAEIERDAIFQTLALAGGNKTRAAHMLGICPRTLRNKLAQYARNTAS